MISGNPDEANKNPGHNPATESETKVTKELVTAIERTIQVLAVVSGIAGTLFWYFHLFPSVVCCYAITILCAIYIAYINFAHNVSKKPIIELFSAGLFGGFILILLNAVATNLILYFQFIPAQLTQPDHGHPVPDPTRLYQNGVPVTSFSVEKYTAMSNVYQFYQVRTLGNVDTANTFQFRDWNVLCQSNMLKGVQVDNKDVDGEDYICRVEGNR